MYLGLLREVLLCQHHAKIQHYLSRTCSSLFQEQATTEWKGKGRAICILMNLIATPNCTLSITSRQTTGHQVLANTACQMLIPNTAFVVGMWVEGSVGGGTLQNRNKKAVPFFSCWPVQFCCSHNWTTWLLFFFLLLFQLSPCTEVQHRAEEKC